MYAPTQPGKRAYSPWEYLTGEFSGRGPRGWAHPSAPQTPSPLLTERAGREPERGGPKPDTQGSVSPCPRLPEVPPSRSHLSLSFWSRVLLRSPLAPYPHFSQTELCSSPKIKSTIFRPECKMVRSLLCWIKINNKSFLEP